MVCVNFNCFTIFCVGCPKAPKALRVKSFVVGTVRMVASAQSLVVFKMAPSGLIISLLCDSPVSIDGEEMSIDAFLSICEVLAKTTGTGTDFGVALLGGWHGAIMTVVLDGDTVVDGVI